MKSLNDPRRRDLIPVGKIVKTHGIHGSVRIKYYNEDKSRFSFYRTILLMDSDGCMERFEVTAAKPYKGVVIAQLAGVENLGRARRLVGASVLVEKAALPELEAGEYYWTDLIGMEVTTTRGDRLGEILDIIPTGGTDVFVVKRGEKEILIPATEKFIQKVDASSGHMVVSLLGGLVENDSI